MAIALVMATALALFLLWPHGPAVILPLVLLTAVLVGAARFGVWPSLAAAFAAFAAYNFLFVEPYFTLRVAHLADMATLAVFLLTAGLTGWLAGRLRDEADSASRRMEHLDRLASLTAALARADTVPTALQAVARQVYSMSGGASIVLEERDGIIHAVFGLPEGQAIDEESLTIASRSFTYGANQPPAAYGNSGRHFAFYPSGITKDAKYVIAAGFPEAVRRHAAEMDRTFRLMATQANEAIEHISRAQDVMQARHVAETEKLRSGLLLSLSHDLRTPLAGILGAVSSLREPSLKLSAVVKADLLQTAEEETRRLSHYVEDLLTLTRLHAGLKPSLVPADANEIAQAARKRAEAAHKHVRFEMTPVESPAALQTDPVLVEQILFNLLDNAAKHAGGNGKVHIAVMHNGGKVRFNVTDDGPGIDPLMANQIFDPLFRGRDSAGAGLGLAIVKSAATVLGASVELVSPVKNDRGTSFIVTVPENP